ncbi:uncharacterized protein LOC133831859 [Humulus lupulus]|uniref:uncharacterized protein LOC133831859 n=1 Tax=Humulus lupulus TaxID=3486 RepID=UPI002B403F4E|nr:uncharacterized protein LOC133831859 [Humulus lupulus]
MVVAEGGSRLGGIGWDFIFRRNLFDREVPSLIEMLDLLMDVDLPDILDDKRIWNSDSSGVFSCQTAFHSLAYAHLGPELPWPKRLWKSGVPSKVKVFGWLLFLDKLSVHDNLQRRRPFHYLSPNWCVNCKNKIRGRKEDGALMAVYRPGYFLGYLAGDE